jgi:hypothetical protein
MSSQLDEAMIGRLFDRMTAVWGAQKMSSMWTGSNTEEVARTWARTLSRFSPQALRAAADAMGDECGAWPPTLTEFVALVRSKVPAPEHRPALPVPKRTDAEVQAGAEQMRKIREMLGNAVRRMPE